MVCSVRLGPKTKKACKYFLQIERTPPNSPPISFFEESSDNISLYTIDWKILTKVLMCSCFVQGFHEEGNGYMKKVCHFYCHCKEEHEYFVYTCKGHPFINKRMDGMQHRCTCTILGSCEILTSVCRLNIWLMFVHIRSVWEQYHIWCLWMIFWRMKCLFVNLFCFF